MINWHEENRRMSAWIASVGTALCCLLFSTAPTTRFAEAHKPVVCPRRPVHPQSYPTIDIPQDLRTRNWAPEGEGSCVHASLVTLLHWQGQHELARWWQRKYSGGEVPEGLAAKANRIGLRFAETRNGDVGFLEWAVRTRRGACVTVEGGVHMVCLIHLDEQWAGTLDNNNPGQVVWQSRNAFLEEWRTSHWQWAITPVYDPPPRKPWF